MSPTLRSASSGSPCTISQRGLSGTWRRMVSTARPMTAPMAKANRHAKDGDNQALFINSSDAAAPSAEPIQNDELMARSAWPRTRLGISSSMAELLVVFLLLLFVLLKARNRAKLTKFL